MRTVNIRNGATTELSSARDEREMNAPTSASVPFLYVVVAVAVVVAVVDVVGRPSGLRCLVHLLLRFFFFSFFSFSFLTFLLDGLRIDHLPVLCSGCSGCSGCFRPSSGGDPEISAPRRPSTVTRPVSVSIFSSPPHKSARNRNGKKRNPSPPIDSSLGALISPLSHSFSPLLLPPLFVRPLRLHPLLDNLCQNVSSTLKKANDF